MTTIVNNEQLNNLIKKSVFTYDYVENNSDDSDIGADHVSRQLNNLKTKGILFSKGVICTLEKQKSFWLIDEITEAVLNSANKNDAFEINYFYNDGQRLFIMFDQMYQNICLSKTIDYTNLKTNLRLFVIRQDNGFIVKTPQEN